MKSEITLSRAIGGDIKSQDRENKLTKKIRVRKTKAAEEPKEDLVEAKQADTSQRELKEKCPEIEMRENNAIVLLGQIHHPALSADLDLSEEIAQLSLEEAQLATTEKV